MKLRILSDGSAENSVVVDDETGNIVEGVGDIQIFIEEGKPPKGTIVFIGISVDVRAEIRHMTD